MDIFLYIIIFIMGTVFGSFYTLAVYRIPRKLDITHTHSFCPNCNHKLGFFELIPVWSYIFLGAKCKECKQKIRPRYFILEIMSGLVFVLLAIAAKINVDKLNYGQLIEILFFVSYLSSIFIIAGIDKERKQIEKSVIYYALVMSVLYIIYLCIIDAASIYRYVMYLAIMVILLIIDNITLRKRAKDSYILTVLILLLVMTIFTGEMTTYLTIIMTLLCLTFLILTNKVKQSKNKTKIEDKEISNNFNFGFYMCTSNLIMLVLTMFIINW